MFGIRRDIHQLSLVLFGKVCGGGEYPDVICFDDTTKSLLVYQSRLDIINDKDCIEVITKQNTSNSH